jgi:asparagine synthase (glutamine-hydrolysing)
MCGIFGAFFTSGNLPNDEEVQKGLRSLRHRGPDYEGSWRSAGLALNHAKLSIQDFTSASNQPFQYGPYVIAFNGEIYNFREIASAAGLDPAMLHSDGEVLGPGYELYRDDLWRKLDGEFAVALFDKSQRRLVLVRDRIGAKPLHYSHCKDGVMFASEAKAILSCGRLPLTFDIERLCSEITFGSWGPRTRTFFKGIETLAPGTYLVVGPLGQSTHKFWRPEHPTGHPRIDELRRSIHDSVAARVAGRGQRSLFLSGGVDSATVAFIAASSSSKPIAYTARYPSATGFDEVDSAAAFASKYGLECRIVDVEPEDFATSICDRICRALEEPPTDPVFYSVWKHYAVASADGSRVVLTGQGNDELWGGYRHEEPLSFAAWKERDPRKIALQFRRRFTDHAITRFRDGTSWTRDFWAGPALLEYFRSELDVAHVERFVARDPSESTTCTATRFAMATALPRHLDQEDRLGMAHSVEARVPLLSNELLDLALAFQAREPCCESREKAPFRRAVERWLGPSIAWRPKRSYRGPLKFLLREATSYLADNWSTLRANPFTGSVINPVLTQADALSIFEQSPALALRVAGLARFAEVWKTW